MSIAVGDMPKYRKPPKVKTPTTADMPPGPGLTVPNSNANGAVDPFSQAGVNDTVGRFRNQADAGANRALASLGRRGDRSSMGYQLLSSGITGGAAANAATQEADYRQGIARDNRTYDLQRFLAETGAANQAGQLALGAGSLGLDQDRFRLTLQQYYQQLAQQQQAQRDAELKAQNPTNVTSGATA